MRRLIFRDTDRDLAALDRLMHHDLRVEYRWLPQMLLIDFVATVQREQTGDTTMRVFLDAEPRGWPAGRRAKDEGRHIARDVEWFYRAEIKAPRDTVYSIAKEHATRQRSAGVHPSVVDTAIKRTKRLLAVLTVEDTV